MKYFEEIDAWLNEILLWGPEEEDSDQWFERVTEAIKDKLLESYRNGQKSKRIAPSTSSEAAKPEEILKARKRDIKLRVFPKIVCEATPISSKARASIVRTETARF